MNGRKTIPIAPRIQKDHRAAIRAAHQSRSGVDPPHPNTGDIESPSAFFSLYPQARAPRRARWFRASLTRRHRPRSSSIAAGTIDRRRRFGRRRFNIGELS
jgi:hypothetical protein